MPPRNPITALLRSLAVLSLAVLALAAVRNAQASPAPPPSPQAPHTVSLNWSASKSAVMGYNVYRADKSGGPYKKVTHTPVNMPQYTDTDVKPGKTYFYVVSSIGDRKKEGPKSGEISATVPAN